MIGSDLLRLAGHNPKITRVAGPVDKRTDLQSQRRMGVREIGGRERFRPIVKGSRRPHYGSYLPRYRLFAQSQLSARDMPPPAFHVGGPGRENDESAAAPKSPPHPVDETKRTTKSQAFLPDLKGLALDRRWDRNIPESSCPAIVNEKFKSSSGTCEVYGSEYFYLPGDENFPRRPGSRPPPRW